MVSGSDTLREMGGVTPTKSLTLNLGVRSDIALTAHHYVSEILIVISRLREQDHSGFSPAT
jgi:hypothetical protein